MSSPWKPPFLLPLASPPLTPKGKGLVFSQHSGSAASKLGAHGGTRGVCGLFAQRCWGHSSVLCVWVEFALVSLFSDRIMPRLFTHSAVEGLWGRFPDFTLTDRLLRPSCLHFCWVHTWEGPCWGAGGIPERFPLVVAHPHLRG